VPHGGYRYDKPIEETGPGVVGTAPPQQNFRLHGSSYGAPNVPAVRGGQALVPKGQDIRKNIPRGDPWPVGKSRPSIVTRQMEPGATTRSPIITESGIKEARQRMLSEASDYLKSHGVTSKTKMKQLMKKRFPSKLVNDFFKGEK
jgi:hypothetical protein